MKRYLLHQMPQKLEPDNLSKIREIIEKYITYEEPVGMKKVFLSSWFYALSWILILPGIIVSYYRAQIMKPLTSTIEKNQEIFIKKWFGDTYSDLTLIGRPGKDVLKAAYLYRGIGIPGDANVQEWSSGFVFETPKKIKISLVSVKWHWVRYVNDKRQHYYKRKIYTKIDNINDKWKDFQFNIFPDNVFTKTSDSLAHKEFNKKWIYKNNNEIKIRQLLTALTQEQLIKLIKNKRDYIGSSLQITKKKDYVLASMIYPLNNDPFGVGPSFGLVDLASKKSVANAIAKNVFKNISYINDNLYIISIFKRILE